MLNVEKLMSLTEMAQGQADGLSAADNIYSNISLDEAVMVGQVQLLESTIEFHNIMDEDANSNMDIFINQIQGNIMTEAANDAKRSGFVAWVGKIKNWIIDKFNKFIQWVKGLASKIKGLFTKKSAQVKTASAKLEEAQKKVEAASKKSPEVAKAVKEAEKDEVTFKMSYVDGYAIKNLDALHNVIKDIDFSEFTEVNDNDINAVIDEVSHANEQDRDKIIKEMESQLNDTEEMDEINAEIYNRFVGAYNYKNKPDDFKTFVKDLSDKRTQKEFKLSEIGFNPLTDSVEKKFAEIISRLSGAKCEINFTETNRIQNLINGLNNVSKEADSAKKKFSDDYSKLERGFSSNTNIDDKFAAMLRKYINIQNTILTDVLGLVSKFTGTSAQILNGYYDSCISLTTACINKLGKAVNKAKEERKDGTKTTNIEYSNKPANQPTVDADIDYIPENTMFDLF